MYNKKLPISQKNFRHKGVSYEIFLWGKKKIFLLPRN